jgi:hypothetical protein
MKLAARVISLFLILGGLLGLLGTYFLVVHVLRQYQDIRVISTTASAVLFAASILSGIELWKGRPRGFKFAKILFALQIPVFTLARFTYEFSTFFSLRVMIGNTNHTIGGNIGSSSNIYLLPQSAGFMAGINLVAVVARYCLYVISRPVKSQSASSSSTTRSELQKPVRSY